MAISCGGWEGDRRSYQGTSSFVQRQLASTPRRPALSLTNWTSEIIWFNLVVVVATPVLSIYGLCSTPFTARTAVFCVLYYLYNMIGMWQ